MFQLPDKGLLGKEVATMECMHPLGCHSYQLVKTTILHSKHSPHIVHIHLLPPHRNEDTKVQNRSYHTYCWFHDCLWTTSCLSQVTPMVALASHKIPFLWSCMYYNSHQCYNPLLHADHHRALCPQSHSGAPLPFYV